MESIPRLPESAKRVELEVTRGTKIGEKVRCSRVVTLLGSRPGCKLVLRHSGISPVHTAIVNDGTNVTVVDLVSSRGTYLNGLKAEHEALSDGDTLSVEPWEFNVNIQPGRNGDTSDTIPFDLEPTPHVIAFEHVGSGRILQPNRDVCVMGRREGCDIHISSKRVSRAHALLINYQGHPAILDLLSAHHTMVNDESVIFRMLKDLDIVTIADSQFRVRTLQHSTGQSEPAKQAEEELPETDPPVKLARDHIDIENVEGSQTWRIADSYERLSKRA
jgi:pSer/pThr/pTyr-binding forkhead associated (FHA) protein